jgi:sugar O-acyltransferase (sialic acid O-acetyltransferase NeuD family)
MDLFIVGAGGAGRELYSWLLDAKQQYGVDLNILGFLDDNPDALKEFNYPIGVIDSIQNYTPQADEQLVLSIAAPLTRHKIVTILKEKNSTFYSFVHPSVMLGANCQLGEGVVICPASIICCDVKLGHFVYINTRSTVGHDTTIGDFTTINGSVEITGQNKIGDFVFFGVGVRTIPCKKIENYATVGAGSIVIRNVKSKTTVFGNPAKSL